MPLHPSPPHNAYVWYTQQPPFPSYTIPVVSAEIESNKWRSTAYSLPTHDLTAFITAIAQLPFTYKAFKAITAQDPMAPRLTKKDYVLHFRPGLRDFANDIIVHRPRMQARLEKDTLTFMNVCREKSTLEAQYNQSLQHLDDTNEVLRLKKEVKATLVRTTISMKQSGDFISLCDRVSAELALDSMLDEDFADDKLEDGGSEDSDGLDDDADISESSEEDDDDGPEEDDDDGSFDADASLMALWRARAEGQVDEDEDSEDDE